MKDYIPPDPSYGALANQLNAESKRQRPRLENEPAERLRQVLLYAQETEDARGNALMLLLMRKDAETQNILPDLLEDKGIGPMAIKYCHPQNGKALNRIRALLESPRQRTRMDAVLWLAKANDNAVIPELLKWLHSNNQGERNVAMQAVSRLDPDQALDVLRKRWDEITTESVTEDGMVLADRLLSLGDARGSALLEKVARQAEGAWASFAAFALLWHEPSLACALLLLILDDGDAEAKQSVVSQVWNIERNPNAFNAEGIHEARRWVEFQIKEHTAGRPVGLPTRIAGS